MVRAVCSGSFDPVTNGHIDIFTRASRMFDELIVCVFNNIRKEPFFPVRERVALLEEATRQLKNVRVASFSGLLPDYMHAHGATVIVRGLRSVTDFEYEQREAQIIHHLAPDIDTVFLLTDERYSFLSSSAVRELAAFKGELNDLVPPCVADAIKAKLSA